MMKKILLILFIQLLEKQLLFGQPIPIPENYSVRDSLRGDVDKDGQEELVVIYNTRTDSDSDLSIPREIIVYKKQDNQWTTWKKSNQAIMGSKDGGMMGDPYGFMKIEKGVLMIEQNGGSGWKWNQTDSYQYVNGNFQLIRFKSFYGKLCEYWLEADFNLKTGKLSVTKEYESCEEGIQKIYKREREKIIKRNMILTLEKRNSQELKIVTPKYKYEITLSVKQE